MESFVGQDFRMVLCAIEHSNGCQIILIWWVRFIVSFDNLDIEEQQLIELIYVVQDKFRVSAAMSK